MTQSNEYKSKQIHLALTYVIKELLRVAVFACVSDGVRKVSDDSIKVHRPPDGHQ